MFCFQQVNGIDTRAGQKLKELLAPKPRALHFVDKQSAPNKRSARDGCCGVYFDVTCGSIPLRIDGLIARSGGKASQVRVFVCNGSYIGHENTDSAWKLVSQLHLVKRSQSEDVKLNDKLKQREYAAEAFANLPGSANAAQVKNATDVLTAAETAVNELGAQQWDETLVAKLLQIKKGFVRATEGKLTKNQLLAIKKQFLEKTAAVERKLQAIAPVLKANETKGFLVLGTDQYQKAVGFIGDPAAQPIPTQLTAVVTNSIGLLSSTPFSKEQANAAYRMAPLKSTYHLASPHDPAEITWAAHGFFFDVTNTGEDLVTVEAIDIAGKERSCKVALWICESSYANNVEEPGKWKKVKSNILSTMRESTRTTLSRGSLSIPAGATKGFYLHSVDSEGVGAVCSQLTWKHAIVLSFVFCLLLSLSSIF